MSEIPEDVMKAAQAALMETRWEMIPTADFDHAAAVIARAILAERERNVAELDSFIANVEVEVDGRSRFNIYDINRECKKSVRYVRDRITGDFDANWLEKPLPSPPSKEGE